MATIARNGSFQLQTDVILASTFVTIAGVKSFDMGTIEVEEVDVTDFDSAGNFREFASGYSEASEGSFVLNYDHQNAEHVALRAAVGGATVTFQATFTIAATGEVVEFDALIKGFSTPVDIGGVMEATVTIKLTGAPTYT